MTDITQIQENGKRLAPEVLKPKRSASFNALDDLKAFEEAFQGANEKAIPIIGRAIDTDADGNAICTQVVQIQ